MAESKEIAWIKTKKRTDRVVFGSQDDKRSGQGHHSVALLNQCEAALEPVFEKFDRELKINRRKRKPIIIKTSWTKDQVC